MNLYAELCPVTYRLGLKFGGHSESQRRVVSGDVPIGTDITGGTVNLNAELCPVTYRWGLTFRGHSESQRRVVSGDVLVVTDVPGAQ